MKVIGAYQRRRLITVDDARRAVIEVANRMAEGVAGPQTQRLAAKLEKDTGIGLAELAEHAKRWPEF